MTWTTELTKLRRYLRDPNGNIWSDAFLKNLYNDVQQDFQHKTSVLEDAQAQRVPSLYQASYMHDWEFGYLSTDESQFYHCLHEHAGYTFCHRWEPQHIAGIATDVSDYGIHFTHPWEAFAGQTPGDVVKMTFPHNFNSMKYIAYNQFPIEATSKKSVQSADASNVTKSGTPIAYYPYDESSNAYVLYPRPSVAFDNELAGEGSAFFADGDDEDTTTGIVAVRIGSFDSSVGVPVDIIDLENNVFMVYDVSPADIQSANDEPEFPVFMRKYIRYGVISRAYSGNSDGQIKSLGAWWQQRYTLGVQLIQRFMKNRKQDRDYRLTTKGSTSRRRYKHPRLPDSYPAVGP